MGRPSTKPGERWLDRPSFSLHLTSEADRRVREAAAKARMSIHRFIEEAVERRLSETENSETGGADAGTNG